MFLTPLSDGSFGTLGEREEYLLLEADYNCLCQQAGAGMVKEVGKGAGLFRLVAEGPNAEHLTRILNEVIDFERLPSGSRIIQLVFEDNSAREVIVYQS